METQKLEIEVPSKTFEKILALSRLTQVKAAELTSEIAILIDQYLDSALIGATQQMLKDLGVDPTLIPALNQNDDIALHQSFHTKQNEDIFTERVDFVGFNMPANEEETEEQETVGSLKDFRETLPTEGMKASAQSKSDFVAKAGNQIEKGAPVYLAEKNAAEIGASILDGDQDEGPVVYAMSAEEEEAHDGFEAGPAEEEFTNMDPELDDDEEFKAMFAGENMGVKDKNNNESGFNDDFMNDIQNEFENDEFDSEPAAPAKAKVSGISHIPNDVDEKELDVLPHDYGIKKIAENNDEGAMSFFNMAMSGKQGDKSKRNGITKKRIVMPGEY